jgi:outer membrane protein assembly factor BamB
MQLSILSLIIAMAGGCKKPSPPEPMVPVLPDYDQFIGTPLNIIWATKFSPDKEINVHNDIHLYNNEVLVAPYLGTTYYPVTNFRADNGQKINDLGICNYNGYFITQADNFIASLCEKKISYYNLNTKQKIFEYTRNIEINRGDNDYSKFQSQDHLLRSISIQDDSVFMVLKSKWQNNVWDTIYKENQLFKNYEVFNGSTDYWIAPNGDSILVITHSMLERVAPQKNVADMLCYNLTTKQNYWHLPAFTPSGIGGAIAIKDNKVYLTGVAVIYCYDLITKQKVWEYYLSVDGDGFGLGDATPIFDGNRLYTKGSNDYIYCFNKNTGAVIWKSKQKLGAASKLVLHKGVLYCGGYYLIGVKAVDGATVLSTRSPDTREGYNFSQGLAIDPATNRLFCADDRKVYCIDISKYNQF